VDKSFEPQGRAAVDPSATKLPYIRLIPNRSVFRSHSTPGMQNSNLMAGQKNFVYMLKGQNLNVFTQLKVVFRE